MFASPDRTFLTDNGTYAGNQRKGEGMQSDDGRTVKYELVDKIDRRTFGGKPLQSDLIAPAEEGLLMQPRRQSKNVTFHGMPATAVGPGHCNLFEGKWVADSQETLYKNYSCPILSQPQNCRGNGRPDQGYERWRWKPEGCSLPRLDVQAFFRLMKGKTLAFVGDSVARNQMESLMCILWQVEVPQNRGFRRMQRWYFPIHSVTIIRIWSAWLTHISHEAFGIVPENITKVHLEFPDEKYMDFLSKLDVLVISSGHWFTKRTAYISKGEVVGAQLWSDKRLLKKVESANAFAITTRTALRAIISHPDYKGLTILRTYSPDHYEGGAWNTGGSCTGKTRPLRDTEVAFNAYTDMMRRHQLEAFAEVERNITNGSKLRLMDITPVFENRADGHPGPYRSLDPKKITKRGPRGEPPPQDCLHWCMPGPIDTWNEFVLEIIRQQQEESRLLYT